MTSFLYYFYYNGTGSVGGISIILIITVMISIVGQALMGRVGAFAGGIIGALGTAVVASPALGGTGVWDYVANGVAEYSMSTQLISQAWGVGVCLVWSGVVSFIAFKLIDMVIGLRVSEEAEREGLDISEHGETAYHM